MCLFYLHFNNPTSHRQPNKITTKNCLPTICQHYQHKITGKQETQDEQLKENHFKPVYLLMYNRLIVFNLLVARARGVQMMYSSPLEISQHISSLTFPLHHGLILLLTIITTIPESISLLPLLISSFIVAISSRGYEPSGCSLIADNMIFLLYYLFFSSFSLCYLLPIPSSIPFPFSIRIFIQPNSYHHHVLSRSRY